MDLIKVRLLVKVKHETNYGAMRIYSYRIALLICTGSRRVVLAFETDNPRPKSYLIQQNLGKNVNGLHKTVKLHINIINKVAYP
jgi:hypothetical protein